MKNISKYITFEEATTSQTAVRNKILNVPNELELINMRLVGTRVFDVIREHFKTPIRVSSFYRNVATNKAVRGSSTSQHVKGQAADISAKGLTAEELYGQVRESGVVVDQCIQEFGRWVHVSYCSTVGENRNQFLRAIKVDGVTKYITDVST